MAQDSVRVEVHGLRELKQSLRGAAKDLDPQQLAARSEIAAAGKDAAELVARHAATKAPYKTGELIGAIKSFGTQAGGRVKGGAKNVPYFGFIDFGGTIRQETNGAAGGGGGVRVIKRPFIKTGRILYPALKEKKAQTIALYRRAVDAVIRKHGLK